MPHIEAETTERDIVDQVEELLAKITPDWRMEQSANSDICKIVVGHGRWRDFDHHSEDNARLIIRAPNLLRRMVEEVKRLRQFGCEHCNCPCTNCGPCGDNHD